MLEEDDVTAETSVETNPPGVDRVAEALLSGCGDAAKTMRLRKGRDIVIAGSRPEYLYVNHDGWLSRYKILHNGGRQIVNFVLPGEIFGLHACALSHSLYSVAALTACTVSKIPLDWIDRVTERDANLAKTLFRSAVDEAAMLGEHLIGAGRRSAFGRVGHLLLELYVRLERVGRTDGTSFAMPLTQEAIGDALGLSPVHVNRTLRALREEKLIALHGKRVTVRDFTALCRLADFDGGYLGRQSPSRTALPAAAEGEAAMLHAGS